MNEETENPMFEADLQQLQQVMSVRTYHSVYKEFLEKRWPKLHPKYEIRKNLEFSAKNSENDPKTSSQMESSSSAKQKSKESVNPGNISNDNRLLTSRILGYLEECVKVSYSMCTHDPKKEFDWEKSAKHYKELGAQEVTDQGVTNNYSSLVVIVSAIIYRTSKGGTLVQKGVLQCQNGTWL